MTKPEARLRPSSPASPPKPGRWRQTAWRWARRGICVLGATALMGDLGLREDELDCEEAVAYLDTCCPDFAGGSIACVYTSGCDTTTQPAISIEESQSILGQSCAQIVAAGLCTTLKDAYSPTSGDLFGDDAFSSRAPVGS